MIWHTLSGTVTEENLIPPREPCDCTGCENERKRKAAAVAAWLAPLTPAPVRSEEGEALGRAIRATQKPVRPGPGAV